MRNFVLIAFIVIYFHSCFVKAENNENNFSVKVGCMAPYYAYMIQKDDSCASVAVKYGLNPITVMAINLNCDKIREGETICLNLKNGYKQRNGYNPSSGSNGGNQNSNYYPLSNNNGGNQNSNYFPPSNNNGGNQGSNYMPSVTCNSPNTPYIVKPADTCDNIAQRYGLELAKLTSINPNCGQRLQPGETICLYPSTGGSYMPPSSNPVYIPSVTCSSPNYPYTVQHGDSCANLAQKYGLDQGKLTSINPNCGIYLQPGQTICLYPSTGGNGGSGGGSSGSGYMPPPSNPIYIPSVTCNSPNMPYTVQQGDTCANVAQRYGLDQAKITSYNPNCGIYLQPGQTICLIPGSSGSGGGSNPCGGSSSGSCGYNQGSGGSNQGNNGYNPSSGGNNPGSGSGGSNPCGGSSSGGCGYNPSSGGNNGMNQGNNGMNQGNGGYNPSSGGNSGMNQGNNGYNPYNPSGGSNNPGSGGANPCGGNSCGYISGSGGGNGGSGSGSGSGYITVPY